MFALYSEIPKNIKVNNILHVIDPAVHSKLKNTIMHDFIYSRLLIYKTGLTIITPNTLKSFSTIVVHDTPHREKFWKSITSDINLITRMKQIIDSNSGVYIGIGYGGEIIQNLSTEIKGHHSSITRLDKPLLGKLNKRILLNYTRFKDVQLQLLDYSRNDTFYCFPPNTGYDSKTKTIIGNGIYMYKNGSEYYVVPNTTISDHKHDNSNELNKITEVNGRFTYTGMPPIVTWESVKW